GNIDEHNRNRAGGARKRGHRRGGFNDHHIRVLLDDLLCKVHAIDITRDPAIVDPDVASVGPTKSPEPLPERRGEPKPFGIICSPHPDCNLLLAATLLRARRERPRSRRATEQRDELAPFHSITSSAMARSFGGISRPSVLAVLRLIT